MIINYYCNMFIVQATVAAIINYDHKTFIVHVTCKNIFVPKALAYFGHGVKVLLVFEVCSNLKII